MNAAALKYLFFACAVFASTTNIASGIAFVEYEARLLAAPRQSQEPNIPTAQRNAAHGLHIVATATLLRCVQAAFMCHREPKGADAKRVGQTVQIRQWMTHAQAKAFAEGQAVQVVYKEVTQNGKTQSSSFILKIAHDQAANHFQ